MLVKVSTRLENNSTISRKRSTKDVSEEALREAVGATVLDVYYKVSRFQDPNATTYKVRFLEEA